MSGPDASKKGWGGNKGILSVEDQGKKIVKKGGGKESSPM